MTCNLCGNNSGESLYCEECQEKMMRAKSKADVAKYTAMGLSQGIVESND